MPKTYSMVRKINLGRYGLQFESVDIGVEGCQTQREATEEIRVWKNKLIEEIKESQKPKSHDESLPF